MTDREAMRLALEAISALLYNDMNRLEIAMNAIAALRQALEQPEPSMGLIPSELAGLEKSDIPIDRGAWSDVPDATKWVNELRGDEEPPNSTTDVVEPEACIVGIKGSAYDPIDTKRAYTYANQPGNVVAYKLGRASSSASLQRAGDFIDSGLILLKELQVEGYGVFDIGAEYTAPPSKPFVSLTDEDIAEGAKQSWVDKQAFESAVWWAEEKLRAKNGY